MGRTVEHIKIVEEDLRRFRHSNGLTTVTADGTFLFGCIKFTN
ncbi:MAG: hypothetical protein SPH40_01140 [Anaerobutyricum soehngenii]|nr:hypothetical protein [Anaerobutyricum soehngenii]